MVIDRLQKLPAKAIIIEGGAKGADELCRIIGKELGFEVKTYPADWNRWGKSAGHIRNKEMLYTEKPDLVIAFRSKRNSRGTNHMIKIATNVNVPCEIYDDFPTK